jgi:hypothetical protein
MHFTPFNKSSKSSAPVVSHRANVNLKRFSHLSQQYSHSQMSPKLFSYAATLWKSSATFILSGLSSYSNGQTTNEGLASVVPVGELTKLSTKLIKTVVTYGIPQFDRIPELVEFFKYFSETYKQFVFCSKFTLFCI